MKKERHFPWPLVWAAEWGAMLLCCALCVFVPLWVQPYSVAQGACLYGAVPLAGLACAYASVRRGARLDTARGRAVRGLRPFCGHASHRRQLRRGIFGRAAGRRGWRGKKTAKKVICIVHSTKARNDAQTDEEGF